MKNMDSDTIQIIIEILETYLNLEINELQTKKNNLKSVNVKTFTDQILSEIELGLTHNTESIIYRINQVILD